MRPSRKTYPFPQRVVALDEFYFSRKKIKDFNEVVVKWKVVNQETRCSTFENLHHFLRLIYQSWPLSVQTTESEVLPLLFLAV